MLFLRLMIGLRLIKDEERKSDSRLVWNDDSDSARLTEASPPSSALKHCGPPLGRHGEGCETVLGRHGEGSETLLLRDDARLVQLGLDMKLVQLPLRLSSLQPLRMLDGLLSPPRLLDGLLLDEERRHATASILAVRVRRPSRFDATGGEVEAMEPGGS